MKEESKRLEVIKFFVIHSDEKNLSLLLFGKNGITVDQMLYKPDNIPAKLKQNSAIKIGGSRFYFLLPKVWYIN